MPSPHPHPPARGQFTVPNAPEPLAVPRDPGPADRPKGAAITYEFDVFGETLGAIMDDAHDRCRAFFKGRTYEITRVDVSGTMILHQAMVTAEATS